MHHFNYPRAQSLEPAALLLQAGYFTTRLQSRIASLSNVARHFNRSASTLSKNLEHYRRTDPSLFNVPVNRSPP